MKHRAALGIFCTLAIVLFSAVSASDEGLNIDSKTLTYERTSGLTVFQGPVTARRGAVTLTCRTLKASPDSRRAVAQGSVTVVDGARGVTLSCAVLEYRDFLNLLVARGDARLITTDEKNQPVTLKCRRLEYDTRKAAAAAEGEVEVDHPEGKAFARRALYDKKEEKVILEGEPKLQTPYGWISARRLIFYFSRGALRAEGAVEALLERPWEDALRGNP